MKSNGTDPLTRREFGLATVAAGSAVAAPSLSGAGDPADGWIDAHVHVWSPDTETYPIDERFDESDMDPPSFTAAELFRHCRPAGVRRIVLIQMSFYDLDHRYLFDVMDDHEGVFSAVALIDHQAGGLRDRMQQMASRGVRGFRLHSRGDAKEWPMSDSIGTLFQEAASQGLAVCPLINPEEIPHVASLCRRFPETTVVVDHFARVGISGTIEPQQLASLCELARFSNVHVKTSAFYALGEKSPPYDDLVPMIRQVLDAFGPERLMWASDCPFQVQGKHTYEASIALIRDRIDFLSEADKQWLLRRTAERVFFS